VGRAALTRGTTPYQRTLSMSAGEFRLNNVCKPRDRTHINLHEPLDVAYWTKEFDKSKWDLAALVRKVGTSVEAIRIELGKPDAAR
jgi:hypothetical protein